MENERKWWESYRRGLGAQARALKISPPPEVDAPTYEVVGEIGRVDQRDSIQSRMALKPGTPEYEAYYTRCPEKKEWDDGLRAIQKKGIGKLNQADPIGSKFLPGVFFTRDVLGEPDLIDGTLNRGYYEAWKNFQLDSEKASPQELTDRIKAYATFLGAAKVRITRLRKEWVYTNYAYPFTPEPYGKPVDLNYKYIICIAIRQNQAVIDSGNGYITNLEIGWRYSVNSLLTITLANVIRLLGFRARPLTPRNSPMMMVPTFIDAGMGEQGRMGIVVTKEFGNSYRSFAVATDLPLVTDRPVDFGLQDFCDKCNVCTDACPSGAIPKERSEHRGVYRWQVNKEKCRKYWSHLGYGCSICQAACPWNFESNVFHDTVRNLNQNIPVFRKPAVWGYKLFYEQSKWKPNPGWALKKE